MTEDGERPDDREGRGTTARTDEPLGDLAEEVRERTGEAEPPDRSESSREGPLADVAAAVDERRRRKRERGDASDAFESVEVGEIDGEKLWEQLAEGESDPGGGPSVTVPAEETDEAAGEWDEAAVDWDGAEFDSADSLDVRTIPKETCHGCPHLGDPPVLTCTHEGTEILAMPDTDHFRVADCPIVVEDEDVDLEIGPDDSEDGESGESESEVSDGPGEEDASGLGDEDGFESEDGFGDESGEDFAESGAFGEAESPEE